VLVAAGVLGGTVIRPDARHMAAGLVLGQACTALVATYAVHRTIGISVQRTKAKRGALALLRYGVPLALTGLAGKFAFQFDRLAVSRKFTPTLYAVYVVGAVELPLTASEQPAVNWVLVPALSRHYVAGDLAGWAQFNDTFASEEDCVAFVPSGAAARRSTLRHSILTSAEYEAIRARMLLAAVGLLAVAAAATAGLVVVGLSGPDPETGTVRSPSAAPAASPETDETASKAASPPTVRRPVTDRLFARDSFWNERLHDETPLDPSSAVLVQALVGEVQRERDAVIGPWIATAESSTPLYRVGPSQPTVRVRLERKNLPGGKALARAFAKVPIPKDANPAAGSDRHMAIWQPSTDKLWEFFGARRTDDGWRTNWGGAIRRVSKSPGYYTARAWRGATRNWGATASSLPVIGGTMLLDELKQGEIDHALAINLPRPRAGQFAWPAQRTDGTGLPTTLPEGARLRLDPALNLEELNLPRLTRMMVEAAQRYGLVVRDQTYNAITFLGEDPSPRSRNPYKRYYLGRPPSELLTNFPWDRLQVLEMHLCTRPPCEPD